MVPTSSHHFLDDLLYGCVSSGVPSNRSPCPPQKRAMIENNTKRHTKDIIAGNCRCASWYEAERDHSLQGAGLLSPTTHKVSRHTTLVCLPSIKTTPNNGKNCGQLDLCVFTFSVSAYMSPNKLRMWDFIPLDMYPSFQCTMPYRRWRRRDN